MPAETTKRCSRCREVKAVTEFYPRRGSERSPDRVGTYCKSCSRETQKERYWKDPEKFIKLSNTRFRFHKYGLTAEGYERLWETTEGKSSLSGKQLVRERHKKNSGHIDHYDDLNGIPVVRGLLSQKENTALGLLDHDPDLCILAAQYLLRSQFDLRELCSI